MSERKVQLCKDCQHCSVHVEHSLLEYEFQCAAYNLDNGVN